MLRAEDLFRGTAETGSVPSADTDPLREAGGLVETQLLDTRVETFASRAGLLLDLRTTMAFAKGDAALLVLHGVREFAWNAKSCDAPRTAWNVVGSRPGSEGGLFTLDLDFLPEARLRLVAGSAEFYVADVPRLGPRVPDYTADDAAAVRNNLPSWNSPFTLRGMCSL